MKKKNWEQPVWLLRRLDFAYVVWLDANLSVVFLHGFLVGNL